LLNGHLTAAGHSSPASADPRLWLSYPPLEAGQTLLLCLPHAGGGAAAFSPWIPLAPPTLRICPVQLPGREKRVREQPVDDLSVLVLTLGPILKQHLDKPFAIFGHSMGALIGFELSRELRRSYGLLPSRLFVSAARAPQLPRRDPLISASSDQELLNELSGLGGMASEVLRHKELLGLSLPTIRADLHLCESYVYRPEQALECPISAFGGLGDEGVTRDGLLAWEEQTSSAFKGRFYPGDHFYIRSNLHHVLAAIDTDLSTSTR